jgi:predicted alpha-1,2-mannosidase
VYVLKGLVRAGLAAIMCVSSVAVPPAASAAAAAPDDVLRYVDPFIGTAGEGAVYPGAAAPFGMLQWSPDTRLRGGGYHYDDTTIRGFSLTHLSGAGCPGFQDVPFMPTLGVPQTPAEWSKYAAHFAHPDEQASPAYYAVRLRPAGIQVELTVNSRSGFGRFAYPPASDATMLIGAGESPLEVSAASTEVVGDDRVAGSVTAGGFCGQDVHYTVYFVAQFERPFTDFGTWTETGPLDRQRVASGPGSGAYVTFGGADGQTVQVQVGISYVSIGNAESNLATAGLDWDFDAARKANAANWLTWLQRIRVGGGTAQQMRRFYTAMYRVFLHPNIFSDVNSEYIGFDDQVHVATDHVQYANFSGWDIYRTEIPLLAWLAPHETSDMVQSLIVDAEQGGALPRWPIANGDSGMMVGDPSDPIIAGAYAFGARDFDAPLALSNMVRGATDASAQVGSHLARPGLAEYLRLGYVPLDGPEVWGAAATTLEYATDDFSIAQLAAAMGDQPTQHEFMQRAQNWQSLFNPSSRFIQPRLSNGGFLAGFEPGTSAPAVEDGQAGFVEGNTWQYTWMVPFNLHGLFAGIGGNAEVVHRLDTLFAELNAGMHRPHASMGNEPSFATPWAYDFAGAPWRTQAIVRKTMVDLFPDAPAGQPGNDDLGAMSAWYVWAALGLYPAIPGVGGLAISTPSFTEATISTGDRTVLRVVADHPVNSAPYVQRVRLNGQDWASPWIPLTALQSDTPTLDVSLGPMPNPTWGADPRNAPPSFS